MPRQGAATYYSSRHSWEKRKSAARTNLWAVAAWTAVGATTSATTAPMEINIFNPESKRMKLIDSSPKKSGPLSILRLEMSMWETSVIRAS